MYNFRIPFEKSEQFAFEREEDFMPLIGSTLGFDSKSSATFEKLPMKTKELLNKIDETHNPAMLPNTPQTSVLSPQVVKTFSDGDEENAQVMNIDKDRLFR